MSDAPLSEQRLNALLRQVDWRFLLHNRDVPTCLDLRKSGATEAPALVTRPAGQAERADLVVLGFPTRRGLESAREALGPGGELVCLWRAPRPAGVRRARARLSRAGFADVGFYRQGPNPGESELWLPLGAPGVAARVLAERPPHSRRQAILRRGWRALAPVCAVARLPGGEAGDEGLPAPKAWALLTGGAESDAKVVGLPFSDEGTEPDVVAKFARVAKADAALEREAAVLRELERERPRLSGVPRIRASGRRAGQVAIVQDAVRGRALNTAMSAEGFAVAAPRVGNWLAALAGEPTPQPAASWSARLLDAPLDELEGDFSRLVPPGLPGRARKALASLGDLPLVCEHRDFGPWNIVIGENGEPAAIDWEDAEPQGLPGLDLIYFLASAAFSIDGVPSGPGRIERARDSHARLLDPGTALGRVTGECVAEYRARLGISEEDFRRLRLLCWIVQSLIACRRLSGEAGDADPAASDADLFIHLAEDELQALESSP
jgi:hypothetical protein